MSFAYPPPWWVALLLAASIAGLTYAQYRRPLAPLTRAQRVTLAACRAAVLAVLMLFLLRPTGVGPGNARNAIVPVIVDTSRSMRLYDDGQPRLTRALSLLKNTLLPALEQSFIVEVYSAGDRLQPATFDEMRAEARRSELRGAIMAVRDRSLGRPVAGIVLLSDGADTGQWAADTAADVPPEWAPGGPPVFAVGFGSSETMPDRQVVGVAAGEQRLDQATIDLHVSLLASGFGRAPFVVRVLGNGVVLETRRVVPAADGAPIDEVFTVAPDPSAPSVYTVEIPADPSEEISENNARSVLVNPAGRRRRVLIVEGAPAFEHTFMRRAWSRDPGLEVDAVGRKGRNVDGQDTFFVQAPAPRAAALTRGFPSRREDLYTYDAVVLANVEGDVLTRAQLTTTAEFVSQRGGGLLVVGSRSFGARGLGATPVEEALPLELSDRGSRGAEPVGTGVRPATNKLVPTSEGERHPVMRIGDTQAEARQRWAALPALAFTSPVGGPRRGASILAVTSAPTGVVYPVVAVQQYGRGRSMTFSGEASWRWKMMLPSTDRSFELFWRQAVRWLAAAAPDPVSMTLPEDVALDEEVSFDVDVRDAAFAPVGDATVDATLRAPGGGVKPVTLRRSAATGHFGAGIRFDRPGLYRVSVEARRPGQLLGDAARWLYAGASDPEFADPRLNDAWLRRLARATGGRYVRPPEASDIVKWLRESATEPSNPSRRDLWQQPWLFAAIVALLSAEWILRRRWGLQ